MEVAGNGGCAEQVSTVLSVLKMASSRRSPKANPNPLSLRKRRRKKGGGSRNYRLFKSLLNGFMLFAAAVFTLLLVTILSLRFINPPTWSWKLQRELDPPAGYPAVSRHQWRDMAQIPPAIQLAVVAAEDQNFLHHHGIDLDAIQNALNEAEEGKGLRGASTITQQTAKNLFLWPRRDWSRKFLEGGLALLLELLWDKQRVLEVYLNTVEFAPGIYGVEAACEYWYRRPLDQITIDQAARLAAILPNPWRYRAEPPSPYVSERAAWIERQMEMLGYVWLRSVEGH